MHKTGALGMFGPKVDSINFYAMQVKDLAIKLEKEQRRTREEEQLPAAFVFFNSRRAAAEASQVSSQSSPDVAVRNCIALTILMSKSQRLELKGFRVTS
jgi:hypothetical protein